MTATFPAMSAPDITESGPAAMAEFSNQLLLTTARFQLVRQTPPPSGLACGATTPAAPEFGQIALLLQESNLVLWQLIASFFTDDGAGVRQLVTLNCGQQ